MADEKTAAGPFGRLLDETAFVSYSTLFDLSVELHDAEAEIERGERILAAGRARLASAREHTRLLEGARSEAASSKSVVYFIQSTTGGPIKIGTSEDVGQRLRKLQTGSPTRLVVRAIVRGGRFLEEILHRDLAAHRLEGEWFSDHADVRWIIDRALAAMNGVA